MTFDSCAKCKRKLSQRTKWPKIDIHICNFFSSKGPYYMPMCHIDGRAGFRALWLCRFMLRPHSFALTWHDAACLFDEFG